MTTPPPRSGVVAPPDPLPKAIWMPASSSAKLPSCYQGSPLEMVGEMGMEMKPAKPLGPHDTIDTLLRFLDDERNIKIKIPGQIPEGPRSQIFVSALLVTGVAREMPQA